MNLSFSEINWLGVVIATLTYSAFSGMWHRQFAFGKQWVKAMGFERPDQWKETNIYYIIPLIGCFVASVSIGLLNYHLRINSLSSAIFLGLTVGIGIALTTTFTNAVIPIMKKPTTFALITGTAHVISLTLVSVLIYLI